MMDYGLILVAHDEVITEAGKNDTTIEVHQPKLPKRGAYICNSLVDIIGYISTDFDNEGNAHRCLYTRKTPTIRAGSRFQYLDPKIPFDNNGFKALTDALARAIETANEHGATVVDAPMEIVNDELSYADIRKEALDIWTKAVQLDEHNAQKILDKAEEIFGRKIRLSEITERQVDLFNVLLDDMRKMNF